MIRSFILAWKKPFDFRSKTSRRDFWFYELATIVLFLVINVLQNIITNLQYAFIESASLISEIFAVVGQTISILSFLFTLGSLIIGISISVRRLRDISKKWTWIFIQLIPILGNLYFYLYLMTRPSNKVINIDDSLDQNLSKIKGSKKVNNKTLNNKKISKKAISTRSIEENQIITSKTNEEKSLKEKLADLKELFDQNLINEEEYNNLKGKLLDL